MLGLLQGISEAAQIRAWLLYLPAFECKSTVVKTTTHAHTCTVLIESDQGGDHQIQPAGRAAVTVTRVGFGDAEAVQAKTGVVIPAHKP